MPTQQLTQATLETIGRPKQSRYEGKPDYRPCLFKLPNGEQRWKSYAVDAPELEWLSKGNTYQAVISGDDFNIIEPQDTMATPTPAAAPPTQQHAATTGQPQLSPEKRKAIAVWLRDDAAPLYGYCSKLAAEHLGEGASPVQLGAAADCLFNAARDRFGF